MLRPVAALFAGLLVTACFALPDIPPARELRQSGYGFIQTLERLELAVASNEMFLIATASASAGAAQRGVKIPGNAVLLVFRNDFAQRMLAASVPAGYEAPLRIYVAEASAGRVEVSWIRPSVVFAGYRDARLDSMASELDAIFSKIVADALAAG